MLPICVQYPYQTCIFDRYVSNILTGHVHFETFVRVVFGRSLSGVCLISLPDICSLYVFNILNEHVYSIFMCPISFPGMYISNPLLESHMLPICVQYPYRTCIFDLYVSNILTGHVYLESFVRVVFGRSLSGVSLISLPDIWSLYVFNIQIGRASCRERV